MSIPFPTLISWLEAVRVLAHGGTLRRAEWTLKDTGRYGLCEGHLVLLHDTLPMMRIPLQNMAKAGFRHNLYANTRGDELFTTWAGARFALTQGLPVRHAGWMRGRHLFCRSDGTVCLWERDYAGEAARITPYPPDDPAWDAWRRQTPQWNVGKWKNHDEMVGVDEESEGPVKAMIKKGAPKRKAEPREADRLISAKHDGVLPKVESREEWQRRADQKCNRPLTQKGAEVILCRARKEAESYLAKQAIENRNARNAHVLEVAGGKADRTITKTLTIGPIGERKVK